VEDVVKIAETILCMQACSRLSQEETAAWAHRELCGTSAGWMLSERPEIKQGVQCSEFPDRKHYIFDC
jgi:hypothetical protein